MMYEELISELRSEICKNNCFDCVYMKTGSTPKLFEQAADAIEELQNAYDELAKEYAVASDLTTVLYQKIMNGETLHSQWVSVEDRLSRRYEDVLVSAKEIPNPIIAWRGSTGFCDALGGHLEVTHWMPLPEPPNHIHDVAKMVESPKEET